VDGGEELVSVCVRQTDRQTDSGAPILTCCVWVSLLTGREYDFQSVLTASSVVYGFAAGAPLGIWFALRQLTGLKVAIITTVCLYGYSLTVFIPAVVRCFAVVCV
jgi:hypothetical protein